MTHFTIAYHISLVNVQTNYCNNYLLILDVIQLNKIKKIYYFHTLKLCGMARVKLRCIMGCLELVSEGFQKKGLMLIVHQIMRLFLWSKIFWAILVLILQKRCPERLWTYLKLFAKKRLKTCVLLTYKSNIRKTKQREA